MNDLCPGDETFAKFAANTLSTTERVELLRHLEGCETCRTTAALLVSSMAPASLADTTPSSNPASLEPGLVLGPYHLVRALGSGSMGTVFAAWDPRLERQVALKLLHADTASLQDEARLMARLSHPNIATVHEVAQWQGRLVLVMELVPGGTLRQWLATRPPVREVVRVFTQLGQALSSAHRAGVVHRDFKPDNVLMDGVGRPRLTDFGLGRLASAGATGPTLVGTPAYLAPAQLDGHPGDEAADQFAFCVALWEALVGQRPFRGSTLQHLREAQRVRPVVPSGASVPVWLERVLRRGLSPDAKDRFPSMDALVEALRRGPVQQQRLAAGLVALVGLAALGGWLVTSRDPCLDAATPLDGLVTPARLQAIDARFQAAGVSFASITSAEVARVLERAAAGWRTTATEVCRETARGGPAAIPTGLMKQACLSVRRRELEALLELFERADRVTVEKAVSASLNLTPAESCAKVLQTDPGTAQEVEQRLEIASLRPLVWTGQWAELTRRLDALRPAVEAVDGGVLAAEYRWLDAYQSTQRSLNEDALARTRVCVSTALANHADLIGVECLFYVTMLEAMVRQRPEAARVSFEVGRALLARVPHTHRDDLNLVNAEFILLRAEGRHDEALALASRAAREFKQRLGDDHPDALVVQSFEALQLTRFDRYAEARELYSRLYQGFRARLGDTHPRTLLMLESLASVDLDLGRVEEALDESRTAWEARRAALGPDSFITAHAQVNVAGALFRLGRLSEAEPMLREALAVFERERGPENGELADPLEELARVVLARGDPSQAVRLFERAVSIRAAAASHTPLELARARAELAKALVAAKAPRMKVEGVVREARVNFEKAGPAYQGEARALEALVPAR